MYYTGYENHQEDELLALAFVDRQPLALELAKRMINSRQLPRIAFEAEQRALRGAGVNPIPCPTLGEQHD